MKKGFPLFSIFLFTLLLAAGCSSSESPKQLESEGKEQVSLTISAAASLKDALDVIQATYKDEHPEVTLKFNFGASGSLQQQISQGAPVDLFFSAAEDKFDFLIAEGMIAESDGIDLLGNELVLIGSKGASAIQSFEDLTNSDIKKISIGTPETVPAGKYAKESLENLGIWQEIESNIVPAKDVRQVLSYVETGNVDAGIVYKTDALVSDKIEIVASADPQTHTPIIYPVGIIKDSKQYDAAKDFYEYVQTERALKVFEEYGFTTQ